MPTKTSAEKAFRQSIRRKKYNIQRKEAYKSAVKDVKKLLASGKVEDAARLLPRLYKAVDKAAKGNTIKKNKASRLKSRLTRMVNPVKKGE